MCRLAASSVSGMGASIRQTGRGRADGRCRLTAATGAVKLKNGPARAFASVSQRGDHWGNMSQPPAKSWGDKEVPTRGLTVISAVFILACCLCCGPVTLGLGPSELMAKQFKVPVYPGSIQVSHWRSGGSDVISEETV